MNALVALLLALLASATVHASYDVCSRRSIENEMMRTVDKRATLKREGDRATQLSVAIEELVMRLNHRTLSTYARDECTRLAAEYDDPCIYGMVNFASSECVIQTDTTEDCAVQRWRAQFVDSTREFFDVDERIKLYP